MHEPECRETLCARITMSNCNHLAVLRKHFSQCFDKQGNFIQEKMPEIVNSPYDERLKEPRSLILVAKLYPRMLANLPPETLLSEDKEHNQSERNKGSQNQLIKQDNPETLNYIVNDWSGKVRLILCQNSNQ